MARPRTAGLSRYFVLGCLVIPFAVAAPLYEDKTDLLVYIDADGTPNRINSVDTWNIRRAHILENMQQVMGPMPQPRPSPPFDLRVDSEESLDGYTRKKISIAVEGADRIPCYLLIPNTIDAPAAAMLCLHETTPLGKNSVVGLGYKPNLQYAEELARRGYITLAPDYPGYGDNNSIDVYAMGYASATMKGIVNHMRCIDFLQSLPEVDPERIGAIGHSLGGHNTLYLGVFDPRVKVMVTSCGFNSFYKYYDGDLTGWSHKGYMPRIAETFDKDPAKMPFDFTEVLGALAPRAVFINAPINDANFEVSGVHDCINAAKPVYQLFDAKDALAAVHPNCEHDFPPETREAAYKFIDATLNHAPLD